MFNHCLSYTATYCYKARMHTPTKFTIQIALKFVRRNEALYKYVIKEGRDLASTTVEVTHIAILY